MRQHLVSVIKDAMSDLRGQLGLMVGGSDYGRQPGLIGRDTLVIVV